MIGSWGSGICCGDGDNWSWVVGVVWFSLRQRAQDCTWLGRPSFEVERSGHNTSLPTVTGQLCYLSTIFITNCEWKMTWEEQRLCCLATDFISKLWMQNEPVIWDERSHGWAWNWQMVTSRGSVKEKWCYCFLEWASEFCVGIRFLFQASMRQRTCVGMMLTSPLISMNDKSMLCLSAFHQLAFAKATAMPIIWNLRG